MSGNGMTRAEARRWLLSVAALAGHNEDRARANAVLEVFDAGSAELDRLRRVQQAARRHVEAYAGGARANVLLTFKGLVAALYSEASS